MEKDGLPYCEDHYCKMSAPSCTICEDLISESTSFTSQAYSPVHCTCFDKMNGFEIKTKEEQNRNVEAEKGMIDRKSIKLEEGKTFLRRR